MKRNITLFVNGMFYGDPYTKKMLWSIFLLSVLTIAAVLTGAIFLKWYIFAIAVVLAAVDAYLIHSLDFGVGFSGSDEDVDVEAFPDAEAVRKKMEENEELETMAMQKEISSEEGSQTPDVMDTLEEEAKTEELPKVKKQHSSLKKESALEEPFEKTVKQRSSKNREQEPEEDIATKYSDKEIKKVFRKYKVKKNHRPILIDESKKYKIKECPAYVWTSRGQCYILLLEKSPRKLEFSIGDVSHMRYEKNVPANQMREYECLQGQSLVSLVFSEYRPIYQSIIKRNHQEEVKNLYEIGPDIKITAASAREILHLLQPDFVITDDVMQSDEYNQYFKQAYKQKILLSDGVLTMKEYQTRIKVILQKLAEAPITPAAFRMTISDMTARQLISTEFANYYSQYNRQYREKKK